MTLGFAVEVIRSGIFYILIVSAPALITGLVVGLVVSIVQATTSIQEQTLTFVPKIAAILLSVFVMGPWMIRMLVQFAQNMFAQIPAMVAFISFGIVFLDERAGTPDQIKPHQIAPVIGVFAVFKGGQGPRRALVPL